MLVKTFDDVSTLLYDIIKRRVKMTSENIESNKIVPRGKIQVSVT